MRRVQWQGGPARKGEIDDPLVDTEVDVEHDCGPMEAVGRSLRKPWIVGGSASVSAEDFLEVV